MECNIVPRDKYRWKQIKVEIKQIMNVGKSFRRVIMRIN